tara:strand:+ start:243 stop:491 length:249 start_codon:yes stop_codon:yes gene_type:complete
LLGATKVHWFEPKQVLIGARSGQPVIGNGVLRDVLQQRGKRRVVRDAKSEGEAVANQYQFTGAVGDAAGRARPDGVVRYCAV